MYFEKNTRVVKKDSDCLVNPKLNEKSPIVEIFSAIVEGKDVTKYNKTVDKVMDKVKELAQKSMAGDFNAKAEFNTIQRYVIEPHLTKVIQLFNFMGTFKDIPYNEQPRVKTYKHESIRSNFQATHGDVPFAVTNWEEYPINTKTISSGYAVDYREVASGNLDKVSEGMEQVKVHMMNQAMNYVIYVLYSKIKNATGVKYYNENAGLTKTGVDDIIKKVRRFGKPALMGDYAVVSQLNDFAGFKADPTDTKAVLLSEAVMEEIRKTGLLTTYNGAPVVELPNEYDVNRLNGTGDNFETYLPEGLLFVVPQGQVAPLQIFRRGRLTSMTAQDIISGTEITRFDMEIGADVPDSRVHEIGLCVDSSLSVPTL